MAEGTGWNRECCRSWDAEPDAKTHRGAKGPPKAKRQIDRQALRHLLDSLAGHGGIHARPTLTTVLMRTPVHRIIALMAIQRIHL